MKFNDFFKLAPTPAPSLAPLAEIDNDPDNEDESDNDNVDNNTRPIEPRIICEHKKKEKRRKKEKKDVASTSTKKDTELKGNPVCPWEDE